MNGNYYSEESQIKEYNNLKPLLSGKYERVKTTRKGTIPI